MKIKKIKSLSEIWIGKNILSLGIQRSSGNRAFVIADAQVEDFTNSVEKTLKAKGWNVFKKSVQVSESLKDFQQAYPFYEWLFENQADRQSVIFAVGGGVIGDVAGFIAGTYMRGIQWVGVPTTLLAQVDSSVGGKTGVNHSRGKNLIGVFHQPSQVLCDIDVLKTLSERDWISGWGEIAKYALIFDSSFFKFLEKNRKKVFSSDSSLSEAVYRCLKWKSAIVKKDEKERAGQREFLNFGHTFAHALEAETGYSFFRHGEAVIWGMRFATRLSRLKKKLSIQNEKTILDFLSIFPIPEIPKTLSDEKLIQRMQVDKKVKNGRPRLVLLKGIGQVASTYEIDFSELQEVLQWLRN